MRCPVWGHGKAYCFLAFVGEELVVGVRKSAFFVKSLFVGYAIKMGYGFCQLPVTCKKLRFSL